MSRPGLPGLVAGLVTATLASQAAAAPSRPAAEPARVHVVRSGETLWGIARQHGLTVDSLARANNLANPDRLRVGERIAIPGSSSDPAAQAPGRGRRPGMAWPSRGVVTSRYGFRAKRHHHGIDISAPVGSPIMAARSGVVRFAGWRSGYGRLVILDHGGGLTTWYGHASKILVRPGQQVAQGKTIALVGTSGRVTGPNVHFEVRRNGIPLNPEAFLARSL